MPWRERNVMDERVKFVARLLEGEKMAALLSDSSWYSQRPTQVCHAAMAYRPGRRSLL